LRLAGHDVATVRDQQLVGTTDEHLFEVVRRRNVRSSHWTMTSVTCCASRQNAQAVSSFSSSRREQTRTLSWHESAVS
jgi:hypothetical protein